MDNETLVRTVDKTALSEADLLAGRRLIEALARHGIEIAAALWLLLSERKAWRLYLASRYVETEGPAKFYRTVESILRDEAIPISMWDIAAVNTKDELVRWLGRSADGNDRGITHLGSGSLLGKDFDEAYAYVPRALTAPQL